MTIIVVATHVFYVLCIIVINYIIDNIYTKRTQIPIYIVISCVVMRICFSIQNY